MSGQKSKCKFEIIVKRFLNYSSGKFSFLYTTVKHHCKLTTGQTNVLKPTCLFCTLCHFMYFVDASIIHSLHRSQETLASKADIHENGSLHQPKVGVEINKAYLNNVWHWPGLLCIILFPNIGELKLLSIYVQCDSWQSSLIKICVPDAQ